LVHVEGETEETFVNEMLSRHLVFRGYGSVGARLLGNSRLRLRRGGIRSWSSVKKDIVSHLKEDQHCIATTMLDYYGMPKSSDRAWPGRAEATSLPVAEKATCVEDALSEAISSDMGSSFNANRFVPYVVMHEFEGLLFSDCSAFARGVGRPDLEPSFQAIRDQFATPEDINDSPITAPSKRVETLVPGYEKPLLGTLAALEIGLETIRSACPHFHGWLSKLEALGR
jgi:hypothetical protein